MFMVYGYNPEQIKRDWPAHNPQGKKESDEDYQKRFDAAFKPRRLAEFDIPDTAKDYVSRCQKAGFKDLSIKFRKYVSSSSAGRPVQTTLAPISELEATDPKEQNELRDLYYSTKAKRQHLQEQA